MEERARSSRRKSQPGSVGPRSRFPSHHDLIERLGNLQSSFVDAMRPIDDDPRLMDASSKDVHKFVEDIRSVIKNEVFGPDGLLDPFQYRDNYEAFERARAAENDMYEVYADDLERYEKRRRKDLGIAESDSDRLAVVRRRREYIPLVQAVEEQASAIHQFLRERPSSP